jgi:peptide/nickel transport system substrate-binding protein
MFRRIILQSVILAASFLAVFGVAQADPSRTLRIAVADDVATMDPTFGQSGATNLFLKNTYLQPIQYAIPAGSYESTNADTTVFEGNSVESWEITNNGRNVVLKIRQGMTFPTTGNPVTADDFWWTLERALGTKAGPAWVWGNVGITSMDQVKRVDEWTIELMDTRPSAIQFPLMRDQTLGLLDSEEVKKHTTGDDPWALEWMSRNYAGNGAFVLDTWEPGTRIVLKANPNFFAEAPYFDRIELLVIPQSSNRLAMLASGDVDIAFALSAAQLDQADKARSVKVLSIPDRQKLSVGLNVRPDATFDNLALRQALAYAVPYDDIVFGVLKDRAAKSAGPMSVNSRFFALYNLADMPSYYTDLDKARELLAEAGHGDGFAFELITAKGVPHVEQAAASLKASFAEIGVDMTITPVSQATMAEKNGQGTYDAYMRDWSTDYVDDPFYHFFLFWGTGVVINWTGYSNSQVDDWYQGTAAIVDDSVRREPYRNAIRQLIKDSPMLWLADGDYTLAVREDIGGITLHPDTLLYFRPLNRM